MARSQNSFERIFPREGETKRTDSPPSVHELFAMTMRDELSASQFAEALVSLHGIRLTPAAARLLSSVDAGCGRLVFRQFQKALQEDSLEPVAVSGRPNVFVDQAKGIMLDNAGSPTPPALRGDNSRPHTDISREDFVKANQLASKMQALGPFRSNLVVPSNDPSINNPLVPHEEQSDDTGRDTMRTATRMFISGELDRASYEQFLTQQGVLLKPRSWLAKLGGRRLKAPKARRVVPTVARWLADRGALTAKGERLKGERASLSNVVPLPPAPVVHLLGAKTNPRRPRRLHRVLSEETSEDFKELDEFATTLTSELPILPKEANAGKVLEQFAHGASIGYGSVFCTGPDVPPGLHPQGKKRAQRPSMMRILSGQSMSISQSLGTSDVIQWKKRRESLVSVASSQGVTQLAMNRPDRGGSPAEKLVDDEDKLMDLPFQDTGHERQMLPWKPARQLLKPGSIATVHTSRAQSARALSARSEVAKEHPHGHTWSSGPWLNRLPDRKWHLRQASISASLASMAYHGRPVVTLQELSAVEEGSPGSPQSLGRTLQSSVEYMHFQGWSLDDDYACTLFRQIKFQDLCVINLSENRLSESFVTFLLEVSQHQPLRNLHSLHLAKNQLGPMGGQSVAKLLEVVKCPLRHFDISDNALGDAAAAQICDSLRQACRASLQGLRMAKNLLGSARFGVSVQALLPQAVHLQALDLHWNKIDGGDACNGAYVDDIGMVRPQLEHRGAPREVEELLQRERVRRQLDGWVRSMPQQLRPERMGRFIEEVKLANEPFSPSLRRVEKSDVFSDGDLGLEKAWVGVHAKVQPAPFSSHLEEVSATESCCWICENWVEQEVCYIPGWSGPASAEEVVDVFAYFSVDGFSRPSRLNRSLERFWARDFVDVSAESEWTRRPFLDDGRLICFRGSRMLPPSYERIHVIFQVNEEICCAKHLPIVPLFSETYVQLHWDGRPNLQDPLPPLPTPLDREPVEIAQANEIDVHTHANAVFEQGAADALFVLEDPHGARNTGIAPRILMENREKRPWTFEKSILKEYQQDAKSIITECFRKDYAITRLDRLWRKLQKDRPYDVAAVLNVLESHYESFMAAYCFESTMDCSGKSCGLSLATFSRLLLGSDATQDSRNLFDVSPHSSSRSRRATLLSEGTVRIPRTAAGELLKARASLPSTLDESHPLNEGFNFGKADAIYTAVLVDLDHLDSKVWKGLPADGLARFQFLEVLVNCSLASDTYSPVVTLRRWIKSIGLGQHVMSCRKKLHAVIFTEDCCHCMRRHQKILQDVYGTYQKRFRIPTEPSLMSFSAFVQFLQDCSCQAFSLESGDLRMAFALGKELCVEQHRSLRHMVLSWSEFLVCTTAAVYLSGDFPEEELADRLLDFILDVLPQALEAGRAAEMQEVGYLTSGGDPRTLQLVGLLTRIFNDADEDGSGWLTVQEFFQALQQPRIIASLEELGVVVGDVKLLFLRMDVDDSGEISLREFIEGLLKLRNDMIVLDKGIRAVRKAFLKLETKYGTGNVTKDQFLEYAKNPRNADALEKAGIRESDVGDVWAAAEQAKSKGTGTIVTAESLVAGYMDLHLEKGRIIRAMNFLNSIFQVADVDGSGALSKVEVGKYLCRKEVTDKLSSLKLFVPDWLEMFDAMDVNGDGDLTWAELSTAMKSFWTQSSQEAPESAEDGLECSQNSFPDMLYCSICHICVAVPIEIIRRDSNTRGPLAAPGENELLKW
ncbi:unnamed protein product [Durusdinium trenchii]|uniref:EF-hand domain-containing protein n=1 Tax=Durusdinium trenchii TaxID=1381693 RepID=A0ABP0H8R5_9DINO